MAGGVGREAPLRHRARDGVRRPAGQRGHPRRRRRGHRRHPGRGRRAHVAHRPARSLGRPGLLHLRVPQPALQVRLQHRVRPALADVPAPGHDEPRVLRQGPDRPARVPGQLRHPGRADAAGLRPVHGDDVDDLRAGLRLHAHQARAAHARRHLDPAPRVRLRREAARHHVPAVVGGAGPPGRGGHHGGGERHRRAGRQGLRRRAAPDPAAGPPGPQAAVGVGQGHRRAAPATPR